MSSSLTGDAVDAAAELGRRSAEEMVVAVDTGHDKLDTSVLIRLRRDDETVDVQDLERKLPAPREAKGKASFHDPASFATYVSQFETRTTRAEGRTTVWADDQARSVVAVFNDHSSADLPGWRDHTANYSVRVDPDWAAWTGRNKKLMSQLDFGEFLQDQAHTIVDPSAAEMHMIATTLTAQRNLSFESAVRLQSGDVEFVYREDTKAQVGKGKGTVEIPERFTIRVAPFVGVEPVEITARLRWRITPEGLGIGYILQRPDIAERIAFETILAGITADLPDSVPVLLGTAPAALR